MKNCCYCGTKIDDNKDYCCKIHEIYYKNKNKPQSAIIKEVEKFSVEDIMQCFSDEVIVNIKTPECIQMIDILIKKDKIDAFLKNDEIIELLFPDEVVHLLKTLQEKHITYFLQKIDVLFNAEGIRTIMEMHKQSEDSSPNDELVESFFVAKTLVY